MVHVMYVPAELAGKCWGCNRALDDYGNCDKCDTDTTTN